MSSLPNSAGISLKPQHYKTILESEPDLGWVEIHPENYMGDGGPPHQYLTAVRELYPLSMHGVGMSLGAANGVSIEHLKKLERLIDKYKPEQVSEHLSWSHWNEIYLNDLLPLPYTADSLEIVCRNIDHVQSVLKREILVENPSTYIDFKQSDYSEPEFFELLVKKTGCGILLDINNIFVSGFNNGFDPYAYLSGFPIESVKEIHLAGHSLKALTDDKKIRIDDHGSPVLPEVWDLYQHFFTLSQSGRPTLIEWDTNIPDFETLFNQALLAETYMEKALYSANTNFEYP